MQLNKNNLPNLKIRVNNAGESERAIAAARMLGFSFAIPAANLYKHMEGVVLFSSTQTVGLVLEIEAFSILAATEITLAGLEAFAFGEAKNAALDGLDLDFLKMSKQADEIKAEFGGSQQNNGHCGQNTCLAMNEATEVKPEPTEAKPSQLP